MAGLLSERPGLPDLALRQVLKACAATMHISELDKLVRGVTDQNNIEQKQRDVWNFCGLAISPDEKFSQLSECQIEAALLAPDEDLAKAYNELCPDIDLLDRIRIGVLGKTHPARENDWWKSDSASGSVLAAIRRLGASTTPKAGEYLKELAPQVHSSWEAHIAHEASEHANKLRDEQFTSPSVDQLKGAMVNGPPISPSDLAAIILEEVERYKSTLRTGSEMPWKRFWNTDSYGAATNPQIENEDRDRLLELLRPRLETYGIAAGLPEARLGENTRADILLMSHAGSNLPIEAKRHYNDELWTSASSQLAGYAADAHACGFGIYLVFWFGTEFRTPKRRDGAVVPESAVELEAMLTDDLPLHMKDKLTVIVLDVSRPISMINATQKRRNKSKSDKG